MNVSSVPIHLVRQYCYCPRVVFYQELLGKNINRPDWVKQGEKFHSLEAKLWQRRNLSRFGLAQGKRFFELAIADSELALHGKVDMAIATQDQVFAIEFKFSNFQKKRKDIMQLTAYAMVLEKHFNRQSKVGFILGAGKVLHKIDINEEAKNQVLKIRDAIQEIRTMALKPRSDATVNQCHVCEYLNFCNDRL